MFKAIIEKIKEVNYNTSVGDIEASEAKVMRADLLVKALTEMASHFGVRLKPLFLDARGEFSIVAANINDSQRAGPLNGFADWLAKAASRTGVNGSSNTLTASDSWCKVTADNAECMLFEYAFMHECQEDPVPPIELLAA